MQYLSWFLRLDFWIRQNCVYSFNQDQRGWPKSLKFKKAPPPPEISESTPCFLSQNKKFDFGETDFNKESGNKKKFQENLIL